MLKNSVIFLFILIFSASLFVFANREHGKLKDKIDHQTSQTKRLYMTSFLGMEFRQNILKSEFKGERIDFLAPNQVEVFQGRFVSFFPNQHVQFDRALADLEGDGFVDVIRRSNLYSIQFFKDVKAYFDDRYFRSDFVRYNHVSRELLGDLPVVIEDMTMRVRGENGFYFDIDKNILEVFGHIDGVMRKE